jgi:hypothetical protein
MPPFNPKENSWYVIDGTLYYVIGPTWNGDWVWQVNDKGVLATGSGEFFRHAVHVPSCTGWDWNWVPPAPQMIGGRADTLKPNNLRLWTYRHVARGDRYVFIAEDKGANDWVEVVFNGEGWVINE